MEGRRKVTTGGVTDSRRSRHREARLGWRAAGVRRRSMKIPGKELPNISAEEHEARAQRKLKPTALRWKAKYTTAAQEFCLAANLYYRNEKLDEAGEALNKAFECYKEKRKWISAAKTLEQATEIAKQQTDSMKVTKLALKCAEYFNKAGQPDSAAFLLQKYAEHSSNYVELLEKASSNVESENRPVQAASYTNLLLEKALKDQNLEAAIMRAEKLIELYQQADHKPSQGKSIFLLYLLYVANGQLSEAENVSQDYGRICTDEQKATMQNIAGKNLFVAELKKSGTFSTFLTRFPFLASALMLRETTFKPTTSTDEKQENESGQKMKETKLDPVQEGVNGVDDQLLHIDEPAAIDQDELMSHNEEKRQLHDSEGGWPGGELTVKPTDSSGIVQFGGVAENIEQYSADGLPDPAVYIDVEGIEHLQPAYYGMTTDQFREFKRRNMTQEYEDDDGGSE